MDGLMENEMDRLTNKCAAGDSNNHEKVGQWVGLR